MPEHGVAFKKLEERTVVRKPRFVAAGGSDKACHDVRHVLGVRHEAADAVRLLRNPSQQRFNAVVADAQTEDGDVGVHRLEQRLGVPDFAVRDEKHDSPAVLRWIKRHVVQHGRQALLKLGAAEIGFKTLHDGQIRAAAEQLRERLRRGDGSLDVRAESRDRHKVSFRQNVGEGGERFAHLRDADA